MVVRHRWQPVPALKTKPLHNDSENLQNHCEGYFQIKGKAVFTMTRRNGDPLRRVFENFFRIFL